MIRDDSDFEPFLGPYDFYIAAYREISTCRNQNGPIPFTAIVEYAKIYNISDVDEFVYIIRTMDDYIVKQINQD